MDSRRPYISPDLSHHLLDGKPLYEDRFDEVMSFHFPPGLAAVRKGDAAYHIRIDGTPAYSQRYIRTFGFYNNLAAVVDASGWFHIHPNGEEVYSQRYGWAGNFQEELCTVRDLDGNYFHIDIGGKRAYSQNWRYAGDFRYGITVVQREDGLYSHIDREGKLIHGQWFIDLDVYHKGFARAKDSGGWMHIDLSGRPVYQRRFISVEPFYNGFSRVELFDGAIEIIDERGKTVHRLRDSKTSEFYRLSDDITAYWRSFAISAAVKVRLFEYLPAEISQLAEKLSMPRENLRLLLKGMAKLDLAKELTHHHWDITSKGQFLRKEHSVSLAPAAEHFIEHCLPYWRKLPDLLKSEGDGKTELFRNFYSSPSSAEVNIEAMASYARFEYPKVVKSLPLSNVETVIDMGGGKGILAQSLAREFSNLKTIYVLDMEEAIEFGRKELPKELDGRVKFMVGDLFKEWPIKADAVILARVLHDWDNPRAGEILKRAHEALSQDGILIVLENIPLEKTLQTALIDLHLFATTGRGRERTLLEMTELLENAGFFKIQFISLLPHLSALVAKKRN